MNFTRLRDFMDRLTAWGIPGNDVIIFLDNREVFRYQSGWADRENKKRMDGTQLFNIYSCSKLATVTAAMQLYEDGRFLLDDPLGDYFPEFREMTVKLPDGTLVPAKNPISVRHLFTMTAGLNYDLKSPALQKAAKLTGGRTDTLTAVRCLAEEPLSFEPGTHWQYSLCHDMLAGLVELISGMKFRDYVQNNIFGPLGMTESCYHASPETDRRLAAQYQFVSEGADGMTAVEQQSLGYTLPVGRVERIGKENGFTLGPEYDSGGAGVITSIGDYGRFVSALANGGIGPNGARILSSSSIDLMRTNQLGPALMPDFCWKQLTGYGYGLGVRTMIDRAKAGSAGPLGEFGWCGAAGATALADPENQLAVFYSHHMLNALESYYMPRLRNVVYACLGT